MTPNASQVLELEDAHLYLVTKGPSRGSHVLRMTNSRRFSPLYSAAGKREKVWCALWRTGGRLDILPENLRALDPESQPAIDSILSRVSLWARKGNEDAAWWLGWWYEGTACCRSTWYYMAAMRLNPKALGWALQRTISDAVCGLTGSSPHPLMDIAFLGRLHEVVTRQWSTDWLGAIIAAEAAGSENVLAAPEQVKCAIDHYLSGRDVDASARLAGVTVTGLHDEIRARGISSRPVIERNRAAMVAGAFAMSEDELPF